MANLMMDFHDHPEFVHELFSAIADYNVAQVREALKYDIDAVYFGDDWGQQHGLQMGPRKWREFILPPFFGNDPKAPFQKQPGVLQIEFDHDGRIRPK